MALLYQPYQATESGVVRNSVNGQFFTGRNDALITGGAIYRAGMDVDVQRGGFFTQLRPAASSGDAAVGDKAVLFAAMGEPSEGSLTITGDPFNTAPAPPGATVESGIRVQVPSDIINPTQSWLAFRVKMGWASNAAPAEFLRLWMWADDANNEMRTITATSGASQAFTFRREAAGTGTSVGNLTFTFADSESITYVAAWEATRIRHAGNGGAFSSANDANIPTLAATTFDLGRDALSATLFIDSTFLWVATGTGVLTDADSAALNAFGDTPPTIGQLRSLLSADAIPSAVWDCVDSNFIQADDTGIECYYEKSAQEFRVARVIDGVEKRLALPATFTSLQKMWLTFGWDEDFLYIARDAGTITTAADGRTTSATTSVVSVGQVSGADRFPVLLTSLAVYDRPLWPGAWENLCALQRTPFLAERVGKINTGLVRGFEEQS